MAGSRFADDDGRPSARIAGVVLAAGAGTRYGGPKALATHPDGTPWLATAIRALADAGCSPVLVVLGARADEAEALLTTLPESAHALVVRADDWALGMSASLRAALRAAAALDPPPLMNTTSGVGDADTGFSRSKRSFRPPGRRCPSWY
ncbi:nucleotidyltransferase family protein, partial [Clavibacter michiganensis]|uniref:nucleotidyltransferase family protein n=1 Tax=Clavibacter michiganensis TaxID=28447 RepID=UPI0020B141E1